MVGESCGTQGLCFLRMLADCWAHMPVCLQLFTVKSSQSEVSCQLPASEVLLVASMS